MLEERLAALESRCRAEAPSLLDEVRSLRTFVSEASFVTSLFGGGDPLEQASSRSEDDATAEVPRVATDTGGDRYRDLGPIGAGGMGEVRRVHDRELDRPVAMKLLHAESARSRGALARFVDEVRITAQLQHPGIVPVYDAGRLADGRLYFTMKEVRGRTLGEVIREVHDASADRWERSPSGWTFRRLVSALHQVSQAVGYAHERGVVHRDLKPSNVMVGAHGEVQVMDWGLSKVLGRTELAADEPVAAPSRDATRAGSVMGTPAYMAPEQARGEVEAIDARTDVYALGAMLYELLTGQAPYSGPTGRAVIQAVLRGPPPSARTATRGDRPVASWGDSAVPRGAVPAPEELVAACERAMAREPAARWPSALAFAAELEAWLDGSKRREQALAVVERADATIPEAASLRARAATLRSEAETELASVPAWSPEDQKLASWAKQDEAEALEWRAALKSLERDELLSASLTHVPELPEAHAALAEDQLERHAAAEASRSASAVGRAEVLLRSHADALPEGHPVRARCVTYLRGDGALTLLTDPPGAEVDLLRYEPYGRRLVARPVRSLGRTPLVEVPLAMGSYLCLIRHPDRPPVRYPVHIGRGAHWDGVRPGSREPLPIHLPAPGDLGPDDCYVPAGWFQAGSDRDYGALPVGTRLWCDAFVMRRFPVTNQEYIAFLDDLVARGLEDVALQHAPRESAANQDVQGALLYGRDDLGRFRLVPDAEGDLWLPDWPVMMVDWRGATAYARWHAERTGAGWRLPWDLDWEKAARGVDARANPWGDGFDPSFCNMFNSRRGRPMLSSVDTFPVDESVYGVRGLAANVRDWCVDRWTRSGPELADRVVAPLAGDDEPSGLAPRVSRGASWYTNWSSIYASSRSDDVPTNRRPGLGFRLVRGLGGGPG